MGAAGRWLWLIAVCAAGPVRSDLVGGGFEGAGHSPSVANGSRARIGGMLAPGWLDDSSWANVRVAYELRADRPHGGRQYQRVRVESITDGRVQMSRDLDALEVGGAYLAEVWLRSPTGTRAVFQVRQPGPPYATYVEASSSGARVWERVRLRLPSPGALPVRLLIIPDGPGVVDVDDAAFEAAGSVSGAPPQRGNLAASGRPGAGPQSGWHVQGVGHDWSADAGKGPLGPGAARLRLKGPGAVVVRLPARFLRYGVEHRLALHARSEPSGMRVSAAVLGAEDRAEVRLDGACTVDWRRLEASGTPRLTRDERHYVRLEVSGGPGVVWIDGLSLHEAGDRTGDPPVGLSLRPLADWGVSLEGEAVRVRATLAGRAPAGASLRLCAVHADGAATRLHDLPVRSGVWSASLLVPVHRMGMYRVVGVVVDGAGRAITPQAETLVALLRRPAPGDRPRSWFGVHVTLREPDVRVAARLGFRWCRLHDASILTKWALAEPEPGRWVWYDAEMQTARRAGLNILGMLCSSPPWASGHVGEDGYFSMYWPPKDLEAWRRYVRTVVGHYRSVIHRWEVWNEPWGTGVQEGFFRGGTPAQYAELLRAAYEEAKRADPTCTVVGVDTYPESWDQAVLAAGAFPYYDVLSFHRYEAGWPGGKDDMFLGVARRLRTEQSKYGAPKPLEDTEGGPGTTGKGSLFSWADPALDGEWSRWADQAPRYYLGVIGAGVLRFSLYSLHNDGRYGEPGSWMLTEPGYLLKPMVATVSALMSFVEGAEWRGRLTPARGASAHWFEQREARWYSREPSVVAVLIADGERPVPLVRRLPPGVRCYDRWGGEVRAPTRAERGPVYVVAPARLGASLRQALGGDRRSGG